LSIVRKITDMILGEIRAILGEYAQEMEDALKRRLKKLLIMGIVISILSALVISLLGSASLFLLIGSLEYLSTFMPMWKAWDIMGLTSGVIGGLLFLVLFLIIRRELKSL
jgi:hypothetical protein